MNNLQLWESVRTPDPRYTKSFQRAGGFSGTAINPTYLIRAATEKWGPMGGKWGAEVMEQGVFPGAPLIDDGKVVGNEQVHWLRLRVWYPIDDKACASVEHFGQTMLVASTRKGFVTDEEAPKKSLTDALGKCLSMLGFAADIHLGLWDDSKYVNDAKTRFAAAEQAATEDKAKQARVEELNKLIDGAQSEADLVTVWQGLTKEERGWMVAKKDARKLVLTRTSGQNSGIATERESSPPRRSAKRSDSSAQDNASFVA